MCVCSMLHVVILRINESNNDCELNYCQQNGYQKQISSSENHVRCQTVELCELNIDLIMMILLLIHDSMFMAPILCMIF